MLNGLRRLGPGSEVGGAGGLFSFDAVTGEPLDHPIHVVEISGGQRKPVSGG